MSRREQSDASDASDPPCSSPPLPPLFRRAARRAWGTVTMLLRLTPPRSPTNPRLAVPSNKPTIYRNALVSETNNQVKFCDQDYWIKGGVACFLALRY